MRVLVTGPRGWKDWQAILKVFLEINSGKPHITLIEGEAQGFDTICRKVAEALDWDIEPYPVKSWYTDGGAFDPEAGHKRNQVMVDTGADVCVAGFMFCTKEDHVRMPPHATHGTADCVHRARRAGIPVRTIEGNNDDRA